MHPNPLKEKSYHFALQIVFFCRELNALREYVLAKQVLKSGTSVGANIEEAIRAQSRADFISKLSIALKEAAETDFWLRLFIDASILSDRAKEMRPMLDEIMRILSSSISTSKKNEG